MKKNDKEQWIDKVMGSLEGSNRAKPNPDLFSSIEDQINGSEGDTLRIAHVRMIAAAVAVLVVLNIGILMQYSQGSFSGDESMVSQGDFSQSLISNYKLYE